jgi:hypothetical protein
VRVNILYLDKKYKCEGGVVTIHKNSLTFVLIHQMRPKNYMLVLHCYIEYTKNEQQIEAQIFYTRYFSSSRKSAKS